MASQSSADLIRAVNQRAWDLRTTVHLSSDYYDVTAFRQNRSTLRAPELDLAGSVSGKRLLHLQCHFGLDTLSWARFGATVTGVDFSAAAIEAARHISAETGIMATFVHADVQQLPRELDNSFDIAVTTYGVMCWLGDLDAWATGIRRVLVPGGRLVLVEFHPLLETLRPGSISGAGSYFGTSDPPEQHTTGTYTDRGADISYREYRWQHTVSDVVTALLRSGLTVTSLTEYPYCVFPLFDELHTTDGCQWWPRDGSSIPYLYSITAREDNR